MRLYFLVWFERLIPFVYSWPTLWWETIFCPVTDDVLSFHSESTQWCLWSCTQVNSVNLQVKSGILWESQLLAGLHGKISSNLQSLYGGSSWNVLRQYSCTQFWNNMPKHDFSVAMLIWRIWTGIASLGVRQWCCKWSNGSPAGSTIVWNCVSLKDPWESRDRNH